MKTKKKLRRLLSLVLSFVLALGLLPFEPTVVHAANATILYITDAVGGVTQTVKADTVDSEGGWSYDAATATLTLDGFAGAYIEANGDLNIVLNGANTITMASDSVYGIKVDGKLTIDDTTSPAADSLDIICNEPAAIAYMIFTGGFGSEKAAYIDGGTVRLKGTTTKKTIYGVDNWLYVNNDANLDIDLSAGEHNIYMAGACIAFYHRTSGQVSVSVNTLSNSSYGIYSLYQQGTGDIKLTAGGKANVVDNTFQQSEGATGTVTVKGYLYNFQPERKTCTVEGYDEVIWSHFTANPLGTGNDYFLCDSTGTPIKDPVIKYAESQPLTVTDSALFDIPDKKVGESFEKTPYWYIGCKGGTGSYSFYLAEDSEPLPEGVSVYAGGSFKGAPTDAHAPGEVKIKVVSGEETAYFTVNYGEIQERDYILTIGGTAVNMASDSTGTGYSYTAANSTLTLSGYKGGPIISEKSLNIVLNGANTITMASDSAYGIKVDGKLTIDDTTSPAADSLDIICNEPAAIAYMIFTGGFGSEKAAYIDGGTVRLKGTTTKKTIYGVDNWLYVNNDANLDIDLSAGEHNIYMAGACIAFYHRTSGQVSVSVNTLSNSSYGIYSLYQQGTGDIKLTAGGKANVVDNTFQQSEGATGTVTVKGYLYNFQPERKTCTVEGYDEVIWSHFTANPLGTGNDYFLCDSTGTPIKDPVIKYAESQPLTVTDSALFDIPDKKVGESFEKTPYWYIGCKGGTGSYSFYLAEDSEPLPDGVSVNSGGGFKGTLTEAHAAGEAKIKVVSGTETAYFTVKYGEITYNNPVISMELDKPEVALNKGESVNLTATIYPSDADKRNVNWSLSSKLGTLEELSYDENSNTRTAKFTAGNTAGTLDITAASLIGGFKKQCTVYIKEAKPTASAGNVYIEGLEAEKAYTVNGTAYTADSSGKIEIDDSWRETTVSIVRTNKEPKCNSDAQVLKVGKYTDIDISTISDTVSLKYSSVTYDGNKKEPSVIITGLIQDTDYTVSYENNVNAGKATVIITGMGAYCGMLYKDFTIDKVSIEGLEATLSDTEYTYDKTEKKPVISVTGLVKDTDYTVAYKDNTAAGTATVTITGKGNYQGTVTKTFTIKPVSIEDKEVNISVTEYEYDGTAKTPVISILGLIKDVDYKVEYSDNIAIGTAKAVVTGIGNYTGSVDKTFTIKEPHTHTYDQESIKEAALKTPADCTNDAVYYKSCSCGEISTADADTFTVASTALGHSWPTEGSWSKDADKHWYECSRCYEKKDEATHTAGDWIVDVEATETAVGSKHKECSICGYKLETAEIPVKGIPHTHSYADTWNKDADKYWKSCACGEKKDEAVHTAGDWIVDVEATETAVGSKHKECIVCGYIMETAEIPKIIKPEKPTPKPAAKGKVIKDKQGISYKVTKSAAKNGEVTFVKPKSGVKGIVKIPDTVTVAGITYKVTAIEANAFKNNKNITKVIIGNNVTVIGKNAFAVCKNLSSVTVGKKVKTISSGAFSGCAKLKTVKLGAAVTSIGDKAFYKCISLSGITIPAKVTKIGKSTFEGCKKLKTITVKSTNLKSVGSRALKGIYAKAKIKVPKSKLTKYKSLFKNKGQSKNVKVTK